MDAEYSKIDEFNHALECYKKNCIVPFEEIADLDIMNFSIGDFKHMGYCNTLKREGINPYRKGSGYYKIDGIDKASSYYLKYLRFLRQKEAENFHVYIWQYLVDCVTIDYTGYILFPMKDGRYWIVRFEYL